MFLFYSVGYVSFAFAVVLEFKGREGVVQGEMQVAELTGDSSVLMSQG